MTYVPPSAPQSIGGVIDDAIRLFRSCWSRCWVLVVIPGIASILFTLAIPLSVPTNVKPSLASLLQMYATIYTPRVIGFYFLLLVFSLIFHGAVLAYEAAIAGGSDTVSLADAVGTGIRRVLWMILGLILFAIAVGFGFAVLIIPGIWLWGRLMFWTPALFVDGQNALDALGTSWRLTKGNWWRGTMIVTVALIIAFVLALVFSFVGGVIAGIVGAASHMDLRTRALIMQLFGIVGNVIYIPLIAAMWIATYRDFKLRREGGDLASRAAALGSPA
jgi:Membrane domain of glycerophosphoryl diester phosphodiesterase